MTRWPWRSMRKIEPSSASAARSYSARSVSQMTTAVAGRRVVGLDHALHDELPAAVRASAGLDDLAGLDAAGADVHPLRRAVDEGPHTLDVRVPAPLGAPVGVRHGHAPRGPLPHTSHTAAMTVLPATEIKRAWQMLPAGRPASTTPRRLEAPTSVARAHIGTVQRRRRCASTVDHVPRHAARSHADGINRLNVYPVPDGDTGTNMARTLDAVVAELDGADRRARRRRATRSATAR